MSIIQCKDLQQLSDFVMNCEQMTISLEDRNSWRKEDIEAIKHKIFKEYQDSFISLEEQVTDSRASFAQALRHIGIEENIIEELFNVYKENGNTRGLITSIDLFNEIISFDKVNENGERDENGEYRNMWQLKYGITLEELMQTFSYALENKLEGVTYVYNEPFLEDVIIYSHTILLTLFICPFKLYFSLINSNSFS